MNSIGGYFELELRKDREYHKNSIKLNTGRNALEFILSANKYKKVFIPYFTCDVILEPFYKLKVDFEFYSIDERFRPIFIFDKINDDEGFLYTNYFGLQDSYISTLTKQCKNLIIDNSQAFFTSPEPGIPTFYSCRKFFGVPDGSYLYFEKGSDLEYNKDYSSERFSHLLKRIELGPEAGYEDSKINDKKLVGQPILRMSEITRALLCNIDYDFVIKKRIENFSYLHDKLSKYNCLDLMLKEGMVPMVYPFLPVNATTNTKKRLNENRVYTASYWPNVLEWCPDGSQEKMFTENIINLPMDQRYSEKHLKRIVDLLL